MAEWVVKLARRLMGLGPGKYCIILTVGERCHWSLARFLQLEAEG